VAKRVKWMKIPPKIFFFCKHFGTGVLIATAFVHVGTHHSIVIESCSLITASSYRILFAERPMSSRPLHQELSTDAWCHNDGCTLCSFRYRTLPQRQDWRTFSWWPNWPRACYAWSTSRIGCNWCCTLPPSQLCPSKTSETGTVGLEWIPC
jgi:hypothetical protein